MGIINWFKSGINEAKALWALSKFESVISKLLNQSDEHTTFFTNVRRIDDVVMSDYAIDAALDDGAPVYMLSDQGKILLARADRDDHIEKKLVPPQEGEYIFVCDYNAAREDVRTEFFSYIRDSKSSSDDIVACYFEPDKKRLCCTSNAEAVKHFKAFLSLRSGKEPDVPLETATRLEFTRKKRNMFFAGGAYNLYVDGVKLGDIGNGKFKSYSVEPGEHVIQAKYMILGSIPYIKSRTLNITVAENQALQLETNYNAIGIFGRLIPYLTALPGVYGIDLNRA
ncbi:MAG: hypothetical protein IJU71_08385 [Selenomonadaceae bacterium]|nr:hypothetical protein [Selenomonadaceae bacterium]